MIITTSGQVEGKKIAKTIGLVKGSTIRARHVGRDIMAGLRGIVGGEISEYTKMMAEAREQAIQRMVEDAEKQGANAIIGMRFTTSMVMASAAEILAYGTGVVLE
ncbi:YbjQ family protein [Chloroflexota bacterium]